MIRFLRVYLPVAGILIAVCYSYYLLSSRDLLRLAKSEDKSLAKLEQQLLTDEFRGYASDLITFANMQEWNNAFESTNTTATREAAEELKILLSTKKNYEKIRLIDLQGQELLRVHFHQGRVKIIPHDDLPNKEHRYYIAASKALHKNQIYISPLDLNWENGKVERPLEPSIRLITPVFDAHGEKRGLLVLNVLVEKMLQRFMDKHVDFPRRSYLINREGNWLHDGVMTENWDFLLPDSQQQQFREKYSEAWLRIHKHEHGQFINDQGMFTFLTLDVTEAAYRSLPDSLNSDGIAYLNNQQPLWKIVEYRSPAELVALSAPFGWRIAAYTLFFLLLLIPLIWRMVVNATVRQRAERELRVSEQKFKQLIEDLPDSMVVLMDAKIVYANKAAIELFCGKHAQAVAGKSVMDFVCKTSKSLVLQRLQAVLDGELSVTIEQYLLTADGSDLFALITPMKIEFEGQAAIQLIIRDISEQRRAEEALRISQQRHELHKAQTHLAMIEWNTDFTVAEWNYGAEIVFGFSAADAKGKHASELILTADQMPVVDMIWQQLLANQGGHHIINDNITKDGRIITCEWHNTALVSGDGSVIGVTSLCDDISEKQRQQAELHKLQQAVEHAGESIMITDADALIEYVNPAFSRVTGYAADEVIGQTPTILNSGHQDDVFYQRFWKKISSGEIWHGSLVDKRKDGSLFPALMSVAPILDGNGNITHYVSIQQDMSEHEELEEKFRQAQKMESLGTLVGGIAHDFNNVLAGMLGNLYLVKKRTTSDVGVQTKLERIEQAGYRAADMIKQLLTFARKGKGKLTPMPVQPFIKEIMKLARSSIPENIALLHELGAQDYRIRADGSQMQQMMLNLLVNAVHALEGRDNPAITVAMHVYEADDDFLFVHRDMDCRMLLCISVTDNGCGIRKSDIERVFEPFFTTKEEGKGTGLGLAMVYGSMRSHDGTVDIESKEGVGTCVKLYFPLLQSEKSTDEEERPEVINGQGELILLVDDHLHVRETMREVLQSFNYRVLMAEDGTQAIQLFSQHASEIGLVLLDIVMPVMGGVEAAERLRELQPDLPILFLSGYEKETFSVEKSAVSDICVLAKPVDLSELSQHMRQCMKK